MSITQHDPRTRQGASPNGNHVHVLWRNLVTVGWYQHRAMLCGTTAFAIALAVVALLVGQYGTDQTDPQMLQLLLLLTDMYALLVGMFHTAPLLAREYEQHTHLLAWSQDVSPIRWLTGKCLLLLSVTTCSALLLGCCTEFMVNQIPTAAQQAFNVPYFDASPLVQTGAALFAFALGLALSTLTRRSVLATSVSFVLFLATRLVLAFAVRPHYLPPYHATNPIGAANGGGMPSDGSLLVASGYRTATGTEAGSESYGCLYTKTPTACLRARGVTTQYWDYQPVDRLGSFHLIEFGIYAVLALLLFTATWRLLRRTRQL